MKIHLECYPCFMRQAIQAGRFVTQDKLKHREILDAVAKAIPGIPEDAPTPAIGRIIHRVVREITGNNDPYRREKSRNLELAKSYYELMKSHIAVADDPMAYAIGFSIIGNVIDYLVFQDIDIEDEIFSLADRPLRINDTPLLKHSLSTAKSVLFLGDNVGEIVFDRVLIEEIDAPVTYAVRGGPILNDATMEDAIAAGLGDVSQIISSGTTAPGALLDECTEEFLELFGNADVVISKGQGNYEAISDVERPVFFLLKASCPVVAEDLDVDIGSLVLKGSNVPELPRESETEEEVSGLQSASLGRIAAH